jgi:aryl-alcohol dehydrogenase-like predicted oxidoreductase
MIKERNYTARFVIEANWTRMERPSVFAQARDRRLLGLAMSWLLANPLVSCVITGATTAQQIDENVRSSTWTLTGDDLAEIDALSA